MALLGRLDMDSPESVEAFLITGQLTSTNIAHPAYTDVVCISWRCLYAAIVESRLDNSALKLQAAYDRMVSMVHGRVRAYGEKWRMCGLRPVGISSSRGTSHESTLRRHC